MPLVFHMSFNILKVISGYKRTEAQPRFYLNLPIIRITIMMSPSIRGIAKSQRKMMMPPITMISPAMI
jgi:hypothetical protein